MDRRRRGLYSSTVKVAPPLKKTQALQPLLIV